jgi:ligand-binding sensor domain-containing protein
MLPAVTNAQTVFDLQSLGIHSKMQASLLYKDNQQRLWLAGNNGLYAFDGLQFKEQIFNHENEINITSLFQDNNDVFWLGCKNGNIYHFKYGQVLKLWSPEEGLPKKTIKGFKQDAIGRLWIATYGEGIYCLDDRLYNINMDDGLSSNDIYEFEIAEDGSIYIATDAGLNVLSFKNGRKEIEIISKSQGLPDEIIKSICKYGDYIYLGFYEAGICRYNYLNNTLDHLIPDWSYGEVTKIFTKDNRIYIGTEKNGVLEYNLEVAKLKAIEGTDQLKVVDIFEDETYNLWICSPDKLLKRQLSTAKLNVPIKNIQAIFKDSNGNLWLGNDKSLFVKKESSIDEINLPKALNILSIVEDDFGNIWLATFGDGLYAYEPVSKRLKVLNEDDGLNNSSVLSIKHNRKMLWLATLGGVAKVDLSENVFSDSNPSIQNFVNESALGANFMYTVFVDSKDRIWFGTDGEGLIVFDDEHFEKIAIDTSLPEYKSVYSIAEDEFGKIWFSTAKQGVYNFDGKGLKHFGLEEGISDIGINGIISDHSQQILVFNATGIDIINAKTDAVLPAVQNLKASSFGNQLNNFFMAKEGCYFSGAEDLFLMKAEFQNADLIPSPLIEKVSVYEDIKDHTKDLKLSYKENFLVVDFTGIWFTKPENLSFKYKLGLEDERWNETRDRRIYYSNLAPGDYEFKLQTGLNGVYYPSSETGFNFTIQKPFWLQLWFIISSIILLGILSYFLIKRREAALKRAAILKKERLQSQFESLKSQMNPHFMFNTFNTLIHIIEDDQELAVEYVEKLSDVYRSLLQLDNNNLIANLNSSPCITSGMARFTKLLSNIKYILCKRNIFNYARLYHHRILRLHLWLDRIVNTTSNIHKSNKCE